MSFLPFCALFTQVIDFWHVPLRDVTGSRIPHVIISETETSGWENPKLQIRHFVSTADSKSENKLKTGRFHLFRDRHK